MVALFAAESCCNTLIFCGRRDCSYSAASIRPENQLLESVIAPLNHFTVTAILPFSLTYMFTGRSAFTPNLDFSKHLKGCLDPPPDVFKVVQGQCE